MATTFLYASSAIAADDADEDTAYDERDWRCRQPFLVAKIRPSMTVEALA
jgi:hypothetical protein